MDWLLTLTLYDVWIWLIHTPIWLLAVYWVAVLVVIALVFNAITEMLS